MSSAYRSENAALRERYLSLEAELAATKRAQAEQDGLDLRETQLRAEMATLTRQIARGRRQLDTPLLAKVSVASPCPASWDDMIGDERARFCGGCQKDVFNLSALTAEEAEALLTEKRGSLCVRFYQRADGTVMTQDCPDGVRRKRTRKLAVLAVGAFGATAAAWGVSGVVNRAEPLQGEVAVGTAPGPMMGAPAPLLPDVVGDVGPASTPATATPATPPPPPPPPAPHAPTKPPMGRPTMGVVRPMTR